MDNVQVLTKRTSTLEATVKKVPAIKPQLEAIRVSKRKAEIETSKIEPAIARATSELKSAVAAAKVLAKQETSLQKDVDNDCANSTDKIVTAEEIFLMLDTSMTGAITKLAFIKSLAQPDVATYFGLPPVIRQEDGTRNQMEAVFQQISAGQKQFSRQSFMDWAEGS